MKKFFIPIIFILLILSGCGQKNNELPSGELPELSCDTLSNILKDEFRKSNYCEEDTNCETMMLGGKYEKFGCFQYVNKGIDKDALMRKLEGYNKECEEVKNDCGEVREPTCINSRCIIKPKLRSVRDAKSDDSFDCDSNAPIFSSFKSFFKDKDYDEWCAECISVKGEPMLHPSTGPYCSRKTTDGGTPCSDSDECDTKCIGTNPNSTEGTCSQYITLPAGCGYYVITEGVAGPELCID